MRIRPLTLFVVASTNDAAALEIIEAFTKKSSGLKRTRTFVQPKTGSLTVDGQTGIITCSHDPACNHAAVIVTIALSETIPSTEAGTWIIRSDQYACKGCFRLDAPNQTIWIPLKSSYWKDQKSRLIDNVVDQLTAFCTQTSALLLKFGQFPRLKQVQNTAAPVADKLITSWITGNQSVTLVSPLCFHVAQDRRSLAEALDTTQLRRAGSFLKSQLGLLPPVKEWIIRTFVPSDLAKILRWGLGPTLLPFIQEAAEEQQLELLARQEALTRFAVDVWQQQLLFPIRLTNLLPEVEELPCELVSLANERAMLMYQRMLNNEPLVVRGMTPEQKLGRYKAEAMLYLLETWYEGSELEGEQQRKVQLGFEVHGGYWLHGNLNQIGTKVLPVLMAPDAVRQHFVAWTDGGDIRKQRRDLDLLLARFNGS